MWPWWTPVISQFSKEFRGYIIAMGLTRSSVGAKGAFAQKPAPGGNKTGREVILRRFHKDPKLFPMLSKHPIRPVFSQETS